jgi:hypothetical protein
MTLNQLISSFDMYSRWASIVQGSDALQPGLRSELKEFERWSAHAIKSLKSMLEEKESEMGKAATIIASLTAALAAANAKLATATTTPASSVYDAADQAAILGFESDDITQTLIAELEPTVAAGLLLPDGVTQQAYTTFNLSNGTAIQTDAANRTLYIHTGTGGFDTAAWPLAGTVAGEKVYYFVNDQNPGDTNGNGVANSWETIAAIVAPPAAPAPASNASSTSNASGASTSSASTAPAPTDGTPAGQATGATSGS